MDNAKSSFNIERGCKDVKGLGGGEKFCVWLGAFRNR